MVKTVGCNLKEDALSASQNRTSEAARMGMHDRTWIEALVGLDDGSSGGGGGVGGSPC